MFQILISSSVESKKKSSVTCFFTIVLINFLSWKLWEGTIHALFNDPLVCFDSVWLLSHELLSGYLFNVNWIRCLRMLIKTPLSLNKHHFLLTFSFNSACASHVIDDDCIISWHFSNTLLDVVDHWASILFCKHVENCVLSHNWQINIFSKPSNLSNLFGCYKSMNMPRDLFRSEGPEVGPIEPQLVVVIVNFLSNKGKWILLFILAHDLEYFTHLFLFLRRYLRQLLFFVCII